MLSLFFFHSRHEELRQELQRGTLFLSYNLFFLLFSFKSLRHVAYCDTTYLLTCYEYQARLAVATATRSQRIGAVDMTQKFHRDRQLFMQPVCYTLIF